MKHLGTWKSKAQPFGTFTKNGNPNREHQKVNRPIWAIEQHGSGQGRPVFTFLSASMIGGRVRKRIMTANGPKSYVKWALFRLVRGEA